jgi:hypothetical protein
MTYAELVELIQNYCENSETTFVANIPTFVRQTEQRIYRTVMLPEFRSNATAKLVENQQYIQRPSDFLSVFSLAVIDATGKYTYLVDKDVNFIREAYPYPTSSGRPKYYGIFDGDATGTEGNLIIGPSADATYEVELHYYRDPESLVTAGTTWLSTNADTALLYGALVEAYTYLKGDADIMKMYLDRYNEALAQLGMIDARSNRDDYRDGRA